MTGPPPTSRHEQEWTLSPFESRHADAVVRWVPDDRDLLWLAPRTAPPLSAQKVIDWAGPRKVNLMLRHHHQDQPVGYGELNKMRIDPRHLWLGHIIVDPAWRRRGIGLLFVRKLLTMAFEQHHAHRVSLIVFPENQSAVKCYEKAGFVAGRIESHRFRDDAAPCRMLRMDITPKQR